jgi:GT2 family glycosyltransferase
MENTKDKKKGLIITVHYGNWKTTNEFIANIRKSLSDDIALFIVNNSPEMLSAPEYEKFITIIKSPSNLGYFGGANHAFNYFDIQSFDYVIICNNDITITDPGFFTLLSEKIEDYDIIAPSIRTADGIEQNPNIEGNFTWSRKIFYKLYFNNYLFAFILNSLVFFRKRISRKVSAKVDEREREILSPHGSFIVFNRTFFDAGGFIDNKLFLYGEEESISAQAKNLKLRIGFVPSLKILHNEHTTTKKGLSYNIFSYQRSAHIYISKKYPDYFH